MNTSPEPRPARPAGAPAPRRAPRPRGRRVLRFPTPSALVHPNAAEALLMAFRGPVAAPPAEPSKPLASPEAS